MSSIEDLITNYQPTESTIELVKSTKIALLAGISGAGKDTIKKQLLKSPEFRDIVSHTTRAPRTNNGCAERDGIDYHLLIRKLPKICYKTMNLSRQSLFTVQFMGRRWLS